MGAVPVATEPAPDPHACCCACELATIVVVSYALWCGWMGLCEATSPRGDDRAMQSAVHDVVVSALPVVLRVMLLTPLVEKLVRWVTGYESQGMSLFATLLLGGGNADGTAARAGWVAIVGDVGAR